MSYVSREAKKLKVIVGMIEKKRDRGFDLTPTERQALVIARSRGAIISEEMEGIDLATAGALAGRV